MNMKILHKLSVTMIFCLMVTTAMANTEAAKFNEQTVSICNQILENIHNEILNTKKDFPDLKLYNDLALKRNQWGLKYIKYQFYDTFQGRKKDELNFIIEFLPIDADKTYTFEGTHFEYSFPLLKLKLVAYQNESNKSRQVSVLPFLKEHARPLHDYQSQFMPVKFSLTADKDSYRPGETINLIVEMENLTSTNIRLRDLSSKSVAFTYDHSVWENDLNLSVPNKGNEVLRPNRTLKRKFRLRGSDKPQTLAVHAVYLMPFKEARPTSTIYIKIAE